MPGLKNFPDQAKQFWAGRNGRQRALLLGGGAATLLLMVFFVRLIGSPDYKPLYTDLDPADAQTLSAQLQAQGIPHEASPDGKTISVPADKLDAARMQTASQGGPRSGRMGFELFDKMSWGQTEFDEKVTYQRALEGELERSIDTLADVRSARVHLVMPTDSVFIDRQRAAKASVILKLRRGSLSKSAALAIARLVSGAVDELRPEDVSIVDADSDRSLGVGQKTGDDGEDQDSQLAARLISTLEPVVGLDKIRASVNVDYDQGTTEESQEKFDPSVSAVLSEQKSQQQTSGTTVPMGVPGTSSNVPTAKNQKPAPAPTQTGGQSSTTESAQYGVNKTILHTVTPAGRVQRITAAILVDDEVVRTVQKGKASYTRRKRSPEEMKQIEELAQAAIGFDPKRGDTMSVQNLSFDTDPAASEGPAVNWATQVQKTVTDYSTLLRPVSLLALFLLAYFLVIRPVQKHVLASSPAPPAPSMVLESAAIEALPAPDDTLTHDALRAAQLRDQTVELIRQKPMHTARALQAWLREEPS